MLSQMKKIALLFTLVSVFSLIGLNHAQAQRSSGDVGIGAQFGQPTGLTLKFYQPRGISTDILLAWDLEEFFFVNVHGLIERHIGNSQTVHYFIGPGLFLGVRDDNNNNPLDGSSSNNVAAGISGTLGLSVLIGITEIYGQVTPRLELLEETSGTVGGGVGVRFYF